MTRRPGLLLSTLALASSLAAGPTIRLPDTKVTTRANGMRVLQVPDREVPLVTLHVRVEGGSSADPAGKEGAASLLADLLGKGAGDRDAATFQEAVDFEGGTFETSVTPRWIQVDAEFPSEDLPLALELLADALRRPRLDGEEFSKLRARRVDEIKASREQPSQVIRNYARAWLLGDHPWARPADGDERSVAKLGLGDVRALGRDQLGPARTWLAVAGDFEPAELERELAARFDSWRGGTPPPRPVPAPTRAGKSRVLLVDKPGSLQTYFRFGNVGVDWSHPSYPARMVANTILGGRFTSRLNTALRIESGLTYGAYSWFADPLGGLFWVSTYTARKTSREAIDLARDVYRKFLAEGLTQAELDSARAYIQGQYAPDNVETAAQRVKILLDLAQAGLDRGLIEGLFGRLDRLTLADVRAGIDAAFPADALAWVVIGEAKDLGEIAAGLGEVTRMAISDPGFRPR